MKIGGGEGDVTMCLYYTLMSHSGVVGVELSYNLGRSLMNTFVLSLFTSCFSLFLLPTVKFSDFLFTTSVICIDSHGSFGSRTKL